MDGQKERIIAKIVLDLPCTQEEIEMIASDMLAVLTVKALYEGRKNV